MTLRDSTTGSIYLENATTFQLFFSSVVPEMHSGIFGCPFFFFVQTGVASGAFWRDAKLQEK